MTHAPGMKARKAPESIGAKAASHSAIRKRRRSNGAVARAASEERLDLSGLTCWVGFMLRVVQVRVFQRYYENPIGREISPGALSTLTAIAANPGVRPGALADALVVRRPNMTKLIDSLIRAGLVRKRTAPGDRRSVALFLTARGRRLIDRTFAMNKTHDESATVALTEEERAALLRLLGKLAADLIGGGAWTKDDAPARDDAAGVRLQGKVGGFAASTSRRDRPA